MYYCKDLNCAGMIADAKAAIIEALTDGEYRGYYCDLHNELFNMERKYNYQCDAEDDLNIFGVFTAIGAVVKYEQDNFGEIETDVSDPYEVANMVWYIIGEEVMCDLFYGCELWAGLWNDEATEETNKALVQWLRDNGRIEEEED